MSSDRALALGEQFIAEATQAGLRVAVAESLTGGLLAASLVAVPGASRVLSGGIVAYDTELKASLLGVDRGLLAARGPVDEEVAVQMARGVRNACAVHDVDGGLQSAGIGVSTTGVAGPDPDPQTGQPAGTVWIGVSSAAGDRAVRVTTEATSRDAIRQATVYAALEEVLAELRGISQGQAR